MGREIASRLKGGEVFALVGDLGAGKTTFVQGFAFELGVKRVTSPTFIIMRSYRAADKTKMLYHLDFYRFANNTKEELDNLGITAIWGRPENIVLIEWADKAKDFLPSNTQFVTFEYLDENTRRIII